MAEEAGFRPQAPSDLLGDITVPDNALDLDAEASAYAERWWENEENDNWTIGVPSADDRAALIFALEGVRQITAVGRQALAAKLLRLAADELDRPD